MLDLVSSGPLEHRTPARSPWYRSLTGLAFLIVFLGTLMLVLFAVAQMATLYGSDGEPLFQ